MAFSNNDGGSSLSEINVTPLVDVMLVLLIIFMVTTSDHQKVEIEKQKESSIKEETEDLVHLNLPVTVNNPIMADPETDKLVILVTTDLLVALTRGIKPDTKEKLTAETCTHPKPNAWARCLVSCKGATELVAWRGCFATVRQKLGGTGASANQKMIEDGIYLQADSGVPYGFVAGVMTQLRELGIDRIDIVTNPDFSKPSP